MRWICRPVLKLLKYYGIGFHPFPQSLAGEGAKTWAALSAHRRTAVVVDWLDFFV